MRQQPNSTYTCVCTVAYVCTYCGSIYGQIFKISVSVLKCGLIKIYLRIQIKKIMFYTNLYLNFQFYKNNCHISFKKIYQQHLTSKEKKTVSIICVNYALYA